MKYFILLLGFVLNTLVVAATQESISLQLAWLHQFQSAGFYIAKEKGFYKDVFLDVTIKEFTHSSDVVEIVLAQNSQYGMGRSSLVVDRAISQKRPLIKGLMKSLPYKAGRNTSGKLTVTCLSNLPGLNKAGSKTSGLVVAAIIIIPSLAPNPSISVNN